MILYDKNTSPSLFDYGIMIHSFQDSALRIIDELRKDPLLSGKIDASLSALKDISISKEDLLRVHSENYVNKLFSDQLESELIKIYELYDEHGNYNRYEPQNAEYPLTDHFKTVMRKVSGTYQCCVNALNKGFCFYLGGGMHHAKRDYGEGFCPVNDIVIALRRLQYEKKILNAWVIDVDAHKGDGTAALTQDDDTIITLSIHMAEGWPLDKKDKSDPSFIPSDIDIPVKKGHDDIYNSMLKEGLDVLSVRENCGLAVIVLGSDPYEKDELQSAKDIKLTYSQMFERDKMIFEFLKERKIPQAYLMSGGYGEHSWEVYANFLKWILKNNF